MKQKNQPTSIEQLIRKALKNVQSRFFRGVFITKEDADDLRKKVTRPIRSKKYKKSF